MVLLGMSEEWQKLVAADNRSDATCAARFETAYLFPIIVDWLRDSLSWICFTEKLLSKSVAFRGHVQWHFSCCGEWTCDLLVKQSFFPVPASLTSLSLSLSLLHTRTCIFTVLYNISGNALYLPYDIAVNLNLYQVDTSIQYLIPHFLFSAQLNSFSNRVKANFKCSGECCVFLV